MTPAQLALIQFGITQGLTIASSILTGLKGGQTTIDDAIKALDAAAGKTAQAYLGNNILDA